MTHVAVYRSFNLIFFLKTTKKKLSFHLDARLHHEALFNHEAHLHQGAHLHQDNQSPLLHHDPKPKASLRVSERTWESRRIKEEMQGIVSPTPLELHKVSSDRLSENSVTMWPEFLQIRSRITYLPYISMIRTT